MKAIKNAKEALKITSENMQTLDECKEQIFNSATLGVSMSIMQKDVPLIVQRELMELGFKISILKDPLGIELIAIYW